MYHYLKILLSLLTLLFSLSAAEINYKIRYIDETQRLMSDQTIQQLVDDALNYEIGKHPYYKAKVDVYTEQNGKEDYFVVYLLRSDIYLFTCYRLEIDNSKVSGIIEDYVDYEQDRVCGTCPDQDVQAVFSYGEENSSSVPAIDSAANIATRAGLETVKLDDREETSQAIKDYLACPNLVIWGRVGHGSSNSISLGSGSINSTYFNSLSSDALTGKTLVINSCNVHKSPLENAILSAGTYFYAGGDVSLSVGRSEEVFMAFMERAITEQMEMGQAIEEAMDEANYRPSYGYSGYDSGPWFFKQDPFIRVNSPGGGEEWEQGATEIIRWGDNIDGNVKIELFKGGSLKETLAASTESDGSFDWNIAGNFELGTDYKLKITSIDSTALFDESDENFSIIPEYIIKTYPYTENFDALETDKTILPKKWKQLGADDLEWIVWTGKTPSKEPDQGAATGPDGDKTSGSGNYIYVESSSPNNPDKKADYTTCKFGLNYLTDPELSFYYHMFSDNDGQDEMGDLYLDICVDGTWENDVVHLSGNKGDTWFEQTVDLNNYKGERVILRFRAITGSGWASDICIDDFKIDGQMAVDNNYLKKPLSFDLKYYGSRLHFDIPDNVKKSKVQINLYNVQGKLVKALVKGNIKTGHYSMPITQTAAGLYLLKMEAEGFNKTINVILAK